MQVVKTSFDERRSFDEKRFNPIPLFGHSDLKVLMVFFKEGQFIPVHSPGVDLVLLIHKGRGEVVAGGESFSVGPGDLVVVPKGEKRGVKALTDLEALHIVTPSPSEADHSGMAYKLAKGQFE